MSLTKWAHRPMTVIKAANWHTRMAVKVTPSAPNCGAWNRILRACEAGSTVR